MRPMAYIPHHIDMAARRPQTHDAFADVYGVGEAKLRDFADLFIAEIANTET